MSGAFLVKYPFLHSVKKLKMAARNCPEVTTPFLQDDMIQLKVKK